MALDFLALNADDRLLTRETYTYAYMCVLTCVTTGRLQMLPRMLLYIHFSTFFGPWDTARSMGTRYRVPRRRSGALADLGQ
jgi:hypothetical protein